MVVEVFITSCHVSLKLNSGPVTTQTRIIRTARTKAVGLPAMCAIHCENLSNTATSLAVLRTGEEALSGRRVPTITTGQVHETIVGTPDYERGHSNRRGLEVFMSFGTDKWLTFGNGRCWLDLVDEPQPFPDPSPQPEPIPRPQPLPKPQPVPDPSPFPPPGPLPMPQPFPSPEPAPVPQPFPPSAQNHHRLPARLLVLGPNLPASYMPGS